MGALTKLQGLDLSDTQVSGELSAVGELTKLQVLSLTNTQVFFSKNC